MLNTMGLSLARAELMGMPHVGIQDEKGYIALETDACCVICGRPANDKHHIVPKGMSGGSTIASIDCDFGHFIIRSPLFAVCGAGNATGCHGDFHAGLYEVKWEWDDDLKHAEWESGDLLAHGWKPHDKRLWQCGHYTIRNKWNNLIITIDQG